VKRNYEDAIPNFERAIELGAQSEEYYYELGLSYVYLGECDKAIPWLEKALEINPDSEPAWGGLDLCEGE